MFLKVFITQNALQVLLYKVRWQQRWTELNSSLYLSGTNTWNSLMKIKHKVQKRLERFTARGERNAWHHKLLAQDTRSNKAWIDTADVLHTSRLLFPIMSTDQPVMKLSVPTRCRPAHSVMKNDWSFKVTPRGLWRCSDVYDTLTTGSLLLL